MAFYNQNSSNEYNCRLNSLVIDEKILTNDFVTTNLQAENMITNKIDSTDIFTTDEFGNKIKLIPANSSSIPINPSFESIIVEKNNIDSIMALYPDKLIINNINNDNLEIFADKIKIGDSIIDENSIAMWNTEFDSKFYDDEYVLENKTHTGTLKFQLDDIKQNKVVVQDIKPNQELQFVKKSYTDLEIDDVIILDTQKDQIKMGFNNTDNYNCLSIGHNIDNVYPNSILIGNNNRSFNPNEIRIGNNTHTSLILSGVFNNVSENPKNGLSIDQYSKIYMYDRTKYDSDGITIDTLNLNKSLLDAWTNKLNNINVVNKSVRIGTSANTTSILLYGVTNNISLNPTNGLTIDEFNRICIYDRTKFDNLGISIDTFNLNKPLLDTWSSKLNNINFDNNSIIMGQGNINTFNDNIIIGNNIRSLENNSIYLGNNQSKIFINSIADSASIYNPSYWKNITAIGIDANNQVFKYPRDHYDDNGIWIGDEQLNRKMLQRLKDLEDSSDDGGGGGLVSSIFGFVGGVAGVVSTAASGASTFKAFAAAAELATLQSLMTGNFQQVFSQLDVLAGLPDYVNQLQAFSEYLNNDVINLMETVTDHGVNLQNANQVLDSISMDVNGYLYNQQAFLESSFGNNGYSLTGYVNYVQNSNPFPQAFALMSEPEPPVEPVPEPELPRLLARVNLSNALRFWINDTETAYYGFDRMQTQTIRLSKFQYNEIDQELLEIDHEDLTIEKLRAVNEIDMSNYYNKSEINTQIYDTKYYAQALVQGETDRLDFNINKFNTDIANARLYTENLTQAQADRIDYQITRINSKAEKTYVDDQLILKTDKSDVYTKTESDSKYLTIATAINAYTKTETDSQLALKTDLSLFNTTKTNLENELTTKMNSDTAINFFYSRAQADSRFPLKSASYTKSESDSKYLTSAINAYTKTESDNTFVKLINKNSFTGDLSFNEHNITIDNQTKLYNLLQNNLLDNSYITIKDNNGYGNNLTGNMIYNLNQMATANGDNINTVVSIDDNGMLAKKQNNIKRTGTSLEIGDAINFSTLYCTIPNNSSPLIDSNYKNLTINAAGLIQSIKVPNPNRVEIMQSFSSNQGWFVANTMVCIPKSETFLLSYDHRDNLPSNYYNFAFYIPLETAGNNINCLFHARFVTGYNHGVSVVVKKPRFHQVNANSAIAIYTGFIYSASSATINGLNGNSIIFEAVIESSSANKNQPQVGGVGIYQIPLIGNY